jgi:hypothetical protein
VRLAEPHDQATGLRRMFAADPAFRALGILGPDARRNARVTAGLALALRRRGSQALILDEAIAPHNVISLLGVLPRRTLADGARTGHLGEVILRGGEGVELIAAEDGIAALGRMEEREALHLADAWHGEPPQWLLLNAAAATGQGLSATADLRVLVLPGVKARLAEAYTVLKSAHAVWPGQTWLVVVEGCDAESGERLFDTLRDTAQRFLGIACELLGTLPREREVNHPVLAEPLGIGVGAKASDAGMGIMAECLIGLPIGESMQFEQYWQRMWLFSRMTAEADMKRARNVRWSGKQG